MIQERVVVLCLGLSFAGICCSGSGQGSDAQDGVDVRDGRDGGGGDDGFTCPPVDDTTVCPEGLRPGRCGLTGRCVECNRDEECGAGRECTNEGACIDFVPCGPENRCPSIFDRCTSDGHCRPACSMDTSCGRDAFCDQKNGSVCRRERCLPGGCCPPGWKVIEGSLECALDDCGAVGLVEGFCGFEGMCVRCWPGRLPWETGGCKAGYCTSSAECAFTDGYLYCFNDSDCQPTGWVGKCMNSRCRFFCKSNMDCPMDICYDGYCLLGKGCPCPPGWRPYYKSYSCYYDPCYDQGRVSGRCGLADTCVDCVVDSQCPAGKICDLQGNCVDPECQTVAECPQGLVCYQSRCVPECKTQQDCPEGTICAGRPGRCITARCTENGICSRWGWKYIPGTLACRYAPCEGTNLKKGVCGLAERCIECIEDIDCPKANPEGCAGEKPCYCTIDGRCDRSCKEGDETLGFVCVNERWWKKCKTLADCGMYHGECRPVPGGEGGYCFCERCRRDGTCAPGWEPDSRAEIPSLLCRKID